MPIEIPSKAYQNHTTTFRIYEIQTLKIFISIIVSHYLLTKTPLITLEMNMAQYSIIVILY